MPDAQRVLEAYRLVEFEARILGSDGRALVLICLEELASSLRQVELADRGQAPAARSRSISRSFAALSALELGVDPSSQLGPAMTNFYRGIRVRLSSQVRVPNTEDVVLLRNDILDVFRALKATIAEKAVA